LGSSGATWVPGFLFVVLGCFFLQKATRRGAKRSWAWGRGGGAVPVSRWGYASWAACFFAIAWIVSRAPEPPIAAVAVFLVCFLTTLAIGFVDTHRYNKSKRFPDPPRA
jgi:hypothetical protein